MPDYLPLCAMRQDLLPVACRSCAWWLTSGATPAGPSAAYSRRREWMTSLDASWGATGLLHPADPVVSPPQSDGSHPAESSSQAALGSIHYAPAARIPRLRDLPLGPLPADAACVFCLHVAGNADGAMPRRLLQKSLAQLRLRGAREAYAFAAPAGGITGGEQCEFFPVDLLADCGFQVLRGNGDLYLMRADLRGLATVLDMLKSTMRKALGHEPAPSPVTMRGAAGHTPSARLT